MWLGDEVITAYLALLSVRDHEARDTDERMIRMGLRAIRV